MLIASDDWGFNCVNGAAQARNWLGQVWDPRAFCGGGLRKQRAYLVRRRNAATVLRSFGQPQQRRWADPTGKIDTARKIFFFISNLQND